MSSSVVEGTILALSNANGAAGQRRPDSKRRAASATTCQPTPGPRKISRQTTRVAVGGVPGRMPSWPTVVSTRQRSLDKCSAPAATRFGRRGITAYLANGGTLEHAQRIAGHASPKTTKLYDRTVDAIPLDEIERIVI